MLRLRNIVLVACLIGSAANTGAYDLCDNKVEDGEEIDGRFMAVPYAIIAHALAEKHCGAEPRPMREKILSFIEETGCGPGTMIYSETEGAISRAESARDLKQLVFHGDPSVNPSSQQVREEAERIANELGGCEALIPDP